MCPATNSSLGVVKPFFASLDFEVTRPWVMPDDFCVTAYTAAELSLLPASPKVWGSSMLKISSPYWTRLLRISTFPVSNLSQLSHAFLSSLGRSQSQGTRASHVSLYSIFPAKVTGDANPKRSHILDIFLRISLLVTLTIKAGKATSIVPNVLFYGTRLAVWSLPSLYPYGTWWSFALYLAQ